MVEDLGFAGLCLGNQGVVEDVENILANLLKLLFDLLSVVADGGHVLVRALGLLLLLDRRDDAPRGTSCADDILVGNGEQVALVYSELAANLFYVNSCAAMMDPRRPPAVTRRMQLAYLGDFLSKASVQCSWESRGRGGTHLHVRDHLCANPPSATQRKRSMGRRALTIVTLSLFAEAGEERLAAGVSMGCKGYGPDWRRTFRAVHRVSMSLTFIIHRDSGL